MRGRACWPEAGLLLINVQDTTTAQSACSRPCTALPLPPPLLHSQHELPNQESPVRLPRQQPSMYAPPAPQSGASAT